MDYRTRKMILFRNRGFSYQKIGKLFNLSRARVHQIINGYHPQKVDWRSKRLDVLIRDDFKCLWCEYIGDKSGEDLAVHHIDFDDRNNDMENLITLCKKCHGSFHGKNNFTNVNKKHPKNLTISSETLIV